MTELTYIHNNDSEKLTYVNVMESVLLEHQNL